MKISVVIPLYNKKSTILRAVNSALNQTYQPQEIIIVNDGSTDGSDQVVAGIDDRLIRYFYQKNQGVSAARNRGVDESKCEWIAFLDADDEWHTNFLAKIYDLNQEFPNCKVIATAYCYGLSNLRYQNIVLKGLKFRGIDGIIHNYFKVASVSSPPIWSSAVVIQKFALNIIGNFPVGVTLGEDLITWAKLAVNEQIAYCRIAHSIFWHDALTMDQLRKPQNPDIVGKQLVELLVNEKRMKTVGLRHYISHWHKMRAHLFIESKEYKDAFHEIFKSLLYNPLNFRVYLFIVYVLSPNILKRIIDKRAKEIERLIVSE